MYVGLFTVKTASQIIQFIVVLLFQTDTDIVRD